MRGTLAILALIAGLIRVARSPHGSKGNRFNVIVPAAAAVTLDVTAQNDPTNSGANWTLPAGSPAAVCSVDLWVA